MCTCSAQPPGGAVFLWVFSSQLSGHHSRAANTYTAGAMQCTPLWQRDRGCTVMISSDSKTWTDSLRQTCRQCSPCSSLAAVCCCSCCVKASCSRAISSSYLAAVFLQCSSSERTLTRSACRTVISRSRSAVAASIACRRTRIWEQKHNRWFGHFLMRLQFGANWQTGRLFA